MTRRTWDKTVDLTFIFLALITVLIALNAYLRSGRDEVTWAGWLPAIGEPLATIMTRGDGVGAVPFSPDSAFLRGRVHVLFFFRTDCAHCGAAVSAWEEILTNWGTEIVDIAVSSEPRRDAVRWLERHSLSFDTLVLAPSPGELRTRWNVPGVPGVILLAPDGRVMLAEFGVPSDDVVARIDAFLLKMTEYLPDV